MMASFSRLWVVLLASVFLSLPLGAQAQRMNVLTPAQYDQALDRVSQAIERQISLEETGNGVAGENPEQALRPILHCQVREPDAEGILTVDNQPLQDALTKVEGLSDPAERQSGYQGILSQVALIRSGLKSQDSANGVSNAAASVRQVLSGDEFSAEPIPPPSKLDQLVDRFDRWLDRLLNRAPSPTPSTAAPNPLVIHIILWAIVIVAAGVIFAMLYQAISRYLANRTPRAQAPESSLAMTAEEASLVATRDFERLLALARGHADSRDFRAALRLVYLSTLVYLDSEGIVRLNRSKTNWEYLRIVRSAGLDDLYTALLPMTRSFDRIWYGLRPAGAAEYESALAGNSDIRRALGPSGPRKAAQPARAMTS